MKKLKAFTQVELLSSAVILGTLASIAIPRMMVNEHNAKAHICKMNGVILNRLSDNYYTVNGKFPNLESLTSDTNLFPDGPPKCPYEERYVMGSNGHIIQHQH
jgi:type II secretory pathway pseudopilin PulG